jgi:hypothetical protein
MVILPRAIQAQEVSHGQVNTWFLLINKVKLNNHFTITNELHERTGAFLHQQGQLLIRPSVDYQLNNNVEFSLGYTFLRVWPYEPYTLSVVKDEHNIWEQVLLKFDAGKMKFQNRFRQENRYVDHLMTQNGETKIEGRDYANRFRYRFTLSRPFLSLTRNDQYLFTTIFDELWINQDSKLRPSSFSRNWFYLGIGYQMDKSANVQLGYMSQYDAVGNNTYVSSPITQLTFFKSF